MNRPLVSLEYNYIYIYIFEYSYIVFVVLIVFVYVNVYFFIYKDMIQHLTAHLKIFDFYWIDLKMYDSIGIQIKCWFLLIGEKNKILKFRKILIYASWVIIISKISEICIKLVLWNIC